MNMTVVEFQILQAYVLSYSTLENADCFIINTCHIREKATEKVYHEIGRAKKYFRNKPKPILVTDVLHKQRV